IPLHLCASLSAGPRAQRNPLFPWKLSPFLPLRPSFAFSFLFTTGITACLQSLAPSLTHLLPACSVNKVCWPLLAARRMAAVWPSVCFLQFVLPRRDLGESLEGSLFDSTSNYSHGL